MPGKEFFKQTVYVDNNDISHKDIIHGIAKDYGSDNVLGVVRAGATWQVTLKKTVNVEVIAENGLEIGGKDVEVKMVGRNVLTVSFFGVPYYISNEQLSQKLADFGVIQKGPWIRKKYVDFPDVENGIVFSRIELPEKVKSLPYATKIGGVNIMVKHNGQIKVCNYCLSPKHMMRSCPERGNKVCTSCGGYGHIMENCPTKQLADEEEEVGEMVVNGESDDGMELSEKEGEVQMAVVQKEAVVKEAVRREAVLKKTVQREEVKKKVVQEEAVQKVQKPPVNLISGDQGVLLIDEEVSEYANETMVIPETPQPRAGNSKRVLSTDDDTSKELQWIDVKRRKSRRNRQKESSMEISNAYEILNKDTVENTD